LKLQTRSLRRLLDRGLVIVKKQILDIDRLQIPDEGALDELSSRIDPPIEIDGGNHRLEQIGQQRLLPPSARFLLAHAEKDDLAHAVGAGFRGQAAGADEISLDLR